MIDVAAWLHGLGLGQYATAFEENGVDDAVLASLTAEDLREIGVAAVGHRRKLLDAIAALRPAAEPAPAAPVAPALPPGERRQVTIIFADLSGFTALSRGMDPEDVHALVARYGELADAAVLACGGTVDKHIGDAVMGLFGAPVAHADDPDRAARAALDIHAGVAALADELGLDLKAHIGLASGEVVAAGVGTVGSGAHGYTVIGDAVNLAARMVSLAGPGETVASDAVRRALVGRAEFEALGEVTLKGFAEPVRAWRLAALPEAGGAPLAWRTPFVGRGAERAQIDGMLAACRRAGRGSVVCLRGEPGIGKTRLLGEMAQAAEAQDFVVHRALILDFGAGRGSDAARTLARALAGVAAADAEAARREGVARALAAGHVAAERVAFLEDLLGVPQSTEARALYDAMDNAARNRGKAEVLAALATGLARQRPLLLAVEDVHWADAVTLDHLAALARATQAAPIVLAMTSRIEGDPLGHGWRAGIAGTSFATLDLGPLTEAEALSMAEGVIDAGLRIARACVDRAGGNPLFLEQLLRNVEEGEEEAVPASVQSLVLARMDRLPEADRRALQAAAVLGQRLEPATLRALLGMPGYDCARLIENALLRPDGEALLFAHALVRDGVYSSLLRARRRELHQRAAAWFAAHGDPGLRAEHLDRAEDPAAAGAYLAAAQARRAAYHQDAALRLAERGLALARAPAERHALMCLRGELLSESGAVAESIAVFREALAGVPEDDAAAECRAALGLAEGLRVSEGLEEALALLDRAQVAAERAGSPVERARIHHLRGNIYFPQGRISECAAEHERGLEQALRAGSVEAEARALGGLADAAYAQGRMRTAVGHFGRCCALSREHGFGRIEVANRSMVGFSRLYLNEAREALEDGLEAVRAAARVGHQRAEMLGEDLCVFACIEAGAIGPGEEHLARAMNLARRLGAGRFEAQGLELRGRLALLAGDRARAERDLRAAMAMSRAVGSQFSGPKTAGVLALALQDPVERRAWLAEGEAMLARGALAHNHFWFRRDAIEAMLEEADVPAALHHAAVLEDYARSESLPWTELFVERAGLLAAAATGDASHAGLAALHATLIRTGMMGYAGPVLAAFGGPGQAAPA